MLTIFDKIHFDWIWYGIYLGLFKCLWNVVVVGNLVTLAVLFGIECERKMVMSWNISPKRICVFGRLVCRRSCMIWGYRCVALSVHCIESMYYNQTHARSIVNIVAVCHVSINSGRIGKAVLYIFQCFACFRYSCCCRGMVWRPAYHFAETKMQKRRKPICNELE